jgi:hypothetical protein
MVTTMNSSDSARETAERRLPVCDPGIRTGCLGWFNGLPRMGQAA